jgi:hypothetical protein
MEASMKAVWLAVVFPALWLGACNKPKEAGADTVGEHGRFAGIGIYSTDRMWSQIAGAEAPKSAATARLQDDREVIVVVDTRTGEVRQCGNLSGYCVGMNPWSKPLPAAQAAPLSMQKHQDDLEREDRAALDGAKSEARPQRKPAP